MRDDLIILQENAFGTVPTERLILEVLLDIRKIMREE